MNQSALFGISPYCILSVLISSTDIVMIQVTLSLPENDLWAPINH